MPDIAGRWCPTSPAGVGEETPILPATPQHHAVPARVCEVLSPGTQRHDRVLKLPFYARAGVRHCWLVDPLAQTLEGYRLEGGGGETVRAEPFEALELPLAPLWDRGEEAPAREL